MSALGSAVAELGPWPAAALAAADLLAAPRDVAVTFFQQPATEGRSMDGGGGGEGSGGNGGAGGGGDGSGSGVDAAAAGAPVELSTEELYSRKEPSDLGEARVGPATVAALV